MTEGDKGSGGGGDALTIQWAMGIPPMKPTEILSWKSLEQVESQVLELVQPGDDFVAKALKWSPMTLGVLRYSFAQKFDRFRGWSGVGLTETFKKAVEDAARVFKRGVGYTDDERAGFSQVEVSGDYKIIKRQIFDRVKLQNSFVVIDRNVYQQWKGRLDLPVTWDEISCEIYVFDSKEAKKNMTSVADIILKWHEALSHKKNMTCWYAVGGGLLGDVVGFCAGLLGLSVIFVPTTLLAMVDACVGGKTGINFEPFGKNQVGLFYFPHEVWIWLDWLRTLPERQWRSGAIECVKHALLEDRQGFLNEVSRVLRTRDMSQLDGTIMGLIGVKAGIVSRDAAETGERVLLNFGHTLGHALETRSQKIAADGHDHLLHGEAVGLGIIYASLLSQKVCGLPLSQVQEITKIISEIIDFKNSLNLKSLCGYLGVKDLSDPYLWQDLSKLMGVDKKNRGGVIQWVLLRQSGQPGMHHSGTWTIPVDMALVEKTWYEFVQALKGSSASML